MKINTPRSRSDPNSRYRCEPRGRSYLNTFPTELVLGQHKLKYRWMFPILAPFLLVFLFGVIIGEVLELGFHRLRVMISKLLT
jgi:hypothetical protein